MIVSITVRNAKKNSTPLDIFTTFLLALIYRFSQAEKRSSHFFFPHVSGHNALSWPGLEPGSSDSEPSALTTGLLNKAVVLACPRYR